MLRVSDNKRFLVHDDGRLFFYLGDTAWELFHRLNREEADRYLQTRAAQRFSVIQAVVLAEFEGLTVPNPYGHAPLQENDPTRPNEAYFAHVDYIVDRAAEMGLFVGMLPTWGDKWNKKWGVGPEIFTPENARAYGRFLGRRYREKPIIWILGGDRPIESDAHRRIIQAMAAGLGEGDEGRHLTTFHPMGGHSSAEWFHDDEWLDFNMLQSGHGKKNQENYNKIAHDYALQPPKPCLDGEPPYEDHPVNWKPENGYFDDADVRQNAYWGLFAGACGHTYGCHDVWQMFTPERKPISAARTVWTEAIELPGAWHMQHVRRLIESRPFLTRVPDQSLIAAGQGAEGDHVQATRGEDYLFVYLPIGSPFTLQLGAISGKQVVAHWFDPREGKAHLTGTFPNQGQRAFTPPTSGRGQDWVLVVDDAAKAYLPPGR